MIGLKPVRDSAGGWDKAIALEPGRRTIMAEYRYSNCRGADHAYAGRQPGASPPIRPVRSSWEQTP
jgi:hypothetical protein